MTKQEAFIHYLINAKDGCSITELMKLAYLIDVGFVKTTGKQLTNFKYIRYYYGPFTKEIYDIVNKFIEEKTVYIDESWAVNGKSVFKVKEKISYKDFSEEEISLIARFLQELEGLSATDLTQLSYKTTPMKEIGATLGGNEEMNTVLNLKSLLVKK